MGSFESRCIPFWQFSLKALPASLMSVREKNVKRRLLRDELLAVLEKVREDRKLGEELLTIIEKIKNQEHLKTEEFLKIHEILWKERPKSSDKDSENLVNLKPGINFD
jgi:hypothetical protein